MTSAERSEVRRTLLSIYGTWHNCGLRKAERGIKAGRLCDVCLDGIAADMKRILAARKGPREDEEDEVSYKAPSTYTPGPWKVVPSPHGDRYDCVQLGDEDEMYCTLEMWPADARLIAAAPDLLEALRALSAAIGAMHQVDDALTNPDHPLGKADSLATLAIEKAEALTARKVNKGRKVKR